MTLEEIKKYSGKVVKLTCYLKMKGVTVLVGRLETRGEWVCLYYYGMSGRNYYFRKRCRYMVEQISFLSIEVV